ncbi:hypothetical protein HanPSC8_Chr17g0797961 [Helianthus annuus]|nr:hypothetical protein HanPSC8_Chr17g0797961 [Helianthus annuus]
MTPYIPTISPITAVAKAIRPISELKRFSSRIIGWRTGNDVIARAALTPQMEESFFISGSREFLTKYATPHVTSTGTTMPNIPIYHCFFVAFFIIKRSIFTPDTNMKYMKANEPIFLNINADCPGNIHAAKFGSRHKQDGPIIIPP